MGISPFFRAALPTLSSLRSPTQTLGYMHGYSGIKPPENLTRLAVHVCYCLVTQKHDLHARVKTCDLQTSPRLSAKQTEEKVRRISI